MKKKKTQRRTTERQFLDTTYNVRLETSQLEYLYDEAAKLRISVAEYIRRKLEGEYCEKCAAKKA
jgi:predicted HicB family RNase H-like nuclease